eukprot:917374-Pleurochrysis_carterae.AAC.1
MRLQALARAYTADSHDSLLFNIRSAGLNSRLVKVRMCAEGSRPPLPSSYNAEAIEKHFACTHGKKELFDRASFAAGRIMRITTALLCAYARTRLLRGKLTLSTGLEEQDWPMEYVGLEHASQERTAHSEGTTSDRAGSSSPSLLTTKAPFFNPRSTAGASDAYSLDDTASSSEATDVDSAWNLALATNAKDIRNACAELGPTFAKLGQVIS